MDKLELQKLRDLPIEGVAERLGLRVSHHKSLCPFHDDHHASLSFHVRRNSFHCFVCDASGGTIDLVMRHLHMGFLEACRWLANDSNIILSEYKPPVEQERGYSFDPKRYERFFLHPWLSDEARHFLFDERHLDPRVIAWCRLTSWRDRNGISWLQIPYYDADGRLIGIQNRNLGLSHVDAPLCVSGSLPTGEGGGRGIRFRFPSGSRCSIYNLPVIKLLQAGDELWITEGCSDCWAMLSSGHKAIAIPSATLLSQADKDFLSALATPPPGEVGRGLSFHMFPDQDAPGERLFLQLKEILPSLVHHHLPKDCKDFGEYYKLTNRPR